MSQRPAIAAVLLPHGLCPGACPYCPTDAADETKDLLPDPVDVSAAVDRVLDREHARGREQRPVEIALYGGDLWALPRPLRTGLLDVAEWEVRRGRATGIRVTLSPRSVLRAPLPEFLARGIHSVELPIHTMEQAAVRRLGSRMPTRFGIEAIGRLNRYKFRSIVHWTPGLPGTSHNSSLEGFNEVLAAGPSAVRILPALVVAETPLAKIVAGSEWRPMTVEQAVLTCRHLMDLAAHKEVEVVRVGLQPEQDLLRGPEVIAGPWDANLRGRVESERMLVRATSALTSAFSLGRRAFTFVVHPREESWLRGMESVNLRILREQFRLDELKVLSTQELPCGELRVFAGVLDEVPPLPPSRGTKRAS